MTFEEAVRREIRLVMKAAGLQHAVVADRVGVSAQHVSRLLAGRTALSFSMAERLLEACGRRPVMVSVPMEEGGGRGPG